LLNVSLLTHSQSQSKQHGIVALSALLILALGGSLWLYASLRASLPTLSGTQELAGLHNSVVVLRDDQGLPTLLGNSRVDIATALGFLHGQDRFFQMDLLRRTAAGELAELFGSVGLLTDREHRLHRLRARARQSVEQLPPSQQALLAAYVRGVNDGLSALGGRPFEYRILGSAPVAWRAEDSVLVVFAMYLNLQDHRASRDNTLGLLQHHLPTDWFDFFVPRVTAWDVPLLTGSVSALAALPHSNISTLFLADHATDDNAEDASEGTLAAGSNSWGVSGKFSRSGAALIAGDMHLDLRVPNIWYRASWYLPGRSNSDPMRRVTGVTLPGVPTMIAGSNENIAWAFTNSYADVSDLVVLDGSGKGVADDTYLTPTGLRHFHYVEETLHVKGAAPEKLLVIESEYGPVIDADESGRYRALRWVAHENGSVDMGLDNLAECESVSCAFEVAHAAGMPAQNIVVGDRNGNIGWTVAGRVPQRSKAAAVPVSSLAVDTEWRGWLPAEQYPQLINPDVGRVWTANNRVGDDAALKALGDGGYNFAARARQIRDDLLSIDLADESSMQNIQLDDRAVLLQRWHDLLLTVLDDRSISAPSPARQQLRDVVAQWNGHASVDSASYRVVRAFRQFFAEQVFGDIFGALKRDDARFNYQHLNQWEEPLWQLVTQQPQQWNTPRFPSWPARLNAAVVAVIAYFDTSKKPLTEYTWGERNRLLMQHPFAMAVPMLSGWLNMPPVPLPGDNDMPRVQAPGFGASQRMVVTPGREEFGLMQMPGGQSGHPMSPFYRAGHDSWAQGTPASFLPGDTRYVLQLQPAVEQAAR